jgi:predicted cupin superfamily sugar epimerase
MHNHDTATESAAAVIARLRLTPHPEGGHYRETYRDRPADGRRGALTVIHYLLSDGERSHWHRVDAAEVWHYAAGAPLALSLRPGEPQVITLGSGFDRGEQAHAVVAPGVWQSAESLGAWTLVSCIVAPAFLFEGFELAPPGWPANAAGERRG